jgi:hypothetical protein
MKPLRGFISGVYAGRKIHPAMVKAAAGFVTGKLQTVEDGGMGVGFIFRLLAGHKLRVRDGEGCGGRVCDERTLQTIDGGMRLSFPDFRRNSNFGSRCFKAMKKEKRWEKNGGKSLSNKRGRFWDWF